MQYYFDEIESCEMIGEYNEEYVYDIEMDDSSHTFFANDILVHNSVYVTLQDVLKSTDWKGDSRDFVLKLNEIRLSSYLQTCFDKYAEKFNTDNLQVLELEKISHSALHLAKKKYILNLGWKEPNIKFDNMTKLKPVGIEIVQRTTPVYIKEILLDVLKMILSNPSDIKYIDIVSKLREHKRNFDLQSPENVSTNVSLNNYNRYIFDDYKTITIGSKCPAQLKASALYNFKVRNNETLKSKYSLIGDGAKVKYYYIKNDSDAQNYGIDVFGFPTGTFPYEFAPQCDYNTQFTKMVINPVNKYLTAIGMKPLNQNMINSISLF